MNKHKEYRGLPKYADTTHFYRIFQNFNTKRTILNLNFTLGSKC